MIAPAPPPAPPSPVSPPARVGPACSLLASEVDRIARRAPDLEAEIAAARKALRGSHAPGAYADRLWAVAALRVAEAAAWCAAVDPRQGAALRALIVHPQTAEHVAVEVCAVAFALKIPRETLGSGGDPRPIALIRHACDCVVERAVEIIGRRVGPGEAERLDAAVCRGTLRAVVALARVP